jgi:NAD(P)-dependent dehydrogenase (short-subunit alcohol dehydrogenase family)
VRARAGVADGVRVSSHACDVSDEAQVQRFRDELLREHAVGHVDLLFSNAGIGGGASFVTGGREEWERTFAVDWWGAYYCARAFLPLLIASGDRVSQGRSDARRHAFRGARYGKSSRRRGASGCQPVAHPVVHA